MSNVVSYLQHWKKNSPNAPAIVLPSQAPEAAKASQPSWNFAELYDNVMGLSQQLEDLDFKPGDRILVMVSQGFELLHVVFALFHRGCIPVLIDPGMGLNGFLTSIQSANPVGAVMNRRARLMVQLTGHLKSLTKQALVCANPKRPYHLRFEPGTNKEPYSYKDDEPCAILFTSGSTGPAKGVVYTMPIFEFQVEQLKVMFQPKPGSLELPGFSLFGLFSTALGLGCVVPPIKPNQPESFDPQTLVDCIFETSPAYLQGSPTIWEKLGDYCDNNGIILPSIERIATFGAPIKPSLVRTWQRVAPEAKFYAPYGATECLPITHCTGAQILTYQKARESGAGTCVGKPLPTMDVKVMRPSSLEGIELDSIEECQEFELGEIIVSGPAVTPEYYNLTDATNYAKITIDETLWHRMGDFGYFDPGGRLWLAGRKNHIINTKDGVFYPYLVESIIEDDPRLRRVALVGIGDPHNPIPVLALQPYEKLSQLEVKKLLRKVQEAHPLFSHIEQAVQTSYMPVDPRHNAKIDRHILGAWLTPLWEKKCARS